MFIRNRNLHGLMPAACDRARAGIFLDPSFYNLPPPLKLFVLTHELGHLNLNTSNEEAADLYAASFASKETILKAINYLEMSGETERAKELKELFDKNQIMKNENKIQLTDKEYKVAQKLYNQSFNEFLKKYGKKSLALWNNNDRYIRASIFYTIEDLKKTEDGKEVIEILSLDSWSWAAAAQGVLGGVLGGLGIGGQQQQATPQETGKSSADKLIEMMMVQQAMSRQEAEAERQRQIAKSDADKQMMTNIGLLILLLAVVFIAYKIFFAKK